MRKRGFYRDLSDDSELINLTPLLDVLFVILIMFILIAPLLDLDRITLAPGSEHTVELTTLNNQKPIKIYLHKDDSIWIGKHQIGLEQLGPTLKEIHKLHPQETPELFPDKSASFGVYQQIKNSVENAGFAELDIVLKKEWTYPQIHITHFSFHFGPFSFFLFAKLL